MKKTKEIHDQIDQNREAYNRRVEAIRNDTRLSEQARLDDLTKAYTEAKERHLKLVGELESERTAERASMFQQAFAPTGGSSKTEKAIILSAHHAALARAETAVKGGSLIGLVEQSHMIGDSNGALAAAHVAYQRGDHKALDRFDELFPTDAEYIRELVEFEEQHGERRSQQKKFADRPHGPQHPTGYYMTGSGFRPHHQG